MAKDPNASSGVVYGGRYLTNAELAALPPSLQQNLRDYPQSLANTAVGGVTPKDKPTVSQPGYDFRKAGSNTGNGDSSIWDVLSGKAFENEKGLLGGYDKIFQQLPGDIGENFGTPATDFTVGYGDEGWNLGTPENLSGAPDSKKTIGQGIKNVPTDEYGVPQLYTGKKLDTTIKFGNIDVGLPTNPLEVNKQTTSPLDQSPEDLEKSKTEQNLQTFDNLSRQGSFEVKAASDRPFGGDSLTNAFIDTPIQSFGDVGQNKKGNTIFRWS